MYDKDGDIVIKEIEVKLNNNIEVTKQDLVASTFTKQSATNEQYW